MYLMSITHLGCNEVMDMSREALKAGFVAHEAMYVDQE